MNNAIDKPNSPFDKASKKELCYFLENFLLDDENAKDEEQKEDDPSCGQCADALKKEGKKKVSVIPSFRREGGRMGNISIDSRSLRSGYGGPGYAAPVARKTVVQKPEPKVFKVSVQ